METDAGIETSCAGVFLLLRAILDARLPWLVETTSYPTQEVPTRLGAMLVALGLRWAGEPGVTNGRIDTGLSVLAGLRSSLTHEALSEAWSETGPVDHARFQAAVLRLLAGQRLVRGSVLHLHCISLGDGNTALVASDETPDLWPLGRVVATTAEAVEIVTGWLEAWEAATGSRPAVIIGDESVLSAGQYEFGASEIVVVPEVEASDSSDTLNELAKTHRTGREALLAALQALPHGRLGLPDADLSVALTAIALLRLWARWLRQFATSSVPYLLDNFIRRPGQVYTDANGFLVQMERRSLDLVIDMAGYTATLERVPWLNNRCVRFRPGG